MFKEEKKERRKNNILVNSVLNFCFLLIGVYLRFVFCYLVLIYENA